MASRSLFLLPLGLLLGGALQAQVGTATPTTATTADLTPLLTGAALWSGGALTGTWKDISTESGKTSRELVSLGPVFGVRPEQVQAYFEGGVLSRVEVVWLEAGNFFGFRASKEQSYRDNRELSPGERSRMEREGREKAKAEEAALRPKRKEFAARFQQLEHDLPAAITAFAKTPGKRIAIGSQGLLRNRVTEWVAEGVNLRFTADDDQLIGLTIQPAGGASRKQVEGTGTVARRRDAKEAVQELPNGDQIITNIPMFNQGDRGYCAIGTLAMVTQYYGLSLNVDQLAARAGYREGDTDHAKIIPIYQAAAREAKLHYTEERGFNFRNALQLVEKGKPLIVWRYFSRERDDFQRAFAQRLAGDPAALLPDPRRDKTDRAQWPDAKSGGHASVITGFNKKRDEVLFTESWGENNRNRRMRAEEMEATAYAVFLLEP